MSRPLPPARVQELLDALKPPEPGDPPYALSVQGHLVGRFETRADAEAVALRMASRTYGVLPTFWRIDAAPTVEPMFHVEQEGDHPGRPVMTQKGQEDEMEKFSEGPWRVQEEPGIGVGGVEVHVVVDRHGQPVANCGSGELGQRNAQLVALAPVIYSVLMRALDEHPDSESEYVSGWVTDARLFREVLGGDSECF